jgi:hypothetical protein
MKTTRFGILILTALTAQACAHRVTEQRIDKKVAQESDVNTPAELTAEVDQAIQSAPGVTPEQKAQLVRLRDSTRKEVDALEEEGLQLRAVLVKDLVSPDYDLAEVEQIKKRIKKIEDQKVTALFNCVEGAHAILGRQSSSHQKMLRAMMNAGPGKKARAN